MSSPSLKDLNGAAPIDSLASPLIDSFGRHHRSLRISVTDQCNIRCQYCMPASVQFMKRELLLSFEHIERFVRVAVECGIRSVRITGGEPLLRRDLSHFIERLATIEVLEDIALTSNGILLAEQVADLCQAGLQRINISLDTLSETTFKLLSRRNGVGRVLAGIDAACGQPGLQVKLNALVLRDVNLDEVCELVRFAGERDLPLRFIEFMPLDGDRNWSTQRVVSGSELRALIEERFGPLRKVGVADASQPAEEYQLVRTGGRLGFIDSVTKPFCNACDRLRLTAEGKLRNCLFGREEWDVKEVLRAVPLNTRQLQSILQSCVRAKHASHGIADADFVPPERAMYQIGG